MNEIVDLLEKYLIDAEVTDIKLGFRCYNCGREWGVRIDEHKSIQSQPGKLLCMKCFTEKRQETIHERETDFHTNF